VYGVGAIDFSGSFTGFVKVYSRTGSSSSPSYSLLDSIQGPQQTNLFGYSISFSTDGAFLAVGAPLESSATGAVYVYQLKSGKYELFGSPLVAPNSAASFQGFRVSLSWDGLTLAVGAPDADSYRGAVYVYKRSAAADPFSFFGAVIGTDEVGDYAQGLGVSLSKDGSTLGFTGVTANNSGHAWVYVNYGGPTYTLWDQWIVPTNDCSCGSSSVMSADGDVFIFGNQYTDSNTGAVWIYKSDGIRFVKVASKLQPNDATGPARFGKGLALSENGAVVVVGGYRESQSQGAVWAFQYDGRSYTQVGSKLVGMPSRTPGYQGFSVTMDAEGTLMGTSDTAITYNSDGTAVISYYGVQTFLFKRSKVPVSKVCFDNFAADRTKCGAVSGLKARKECLLAANYRRAECIRAQTE
jgi:hypothetical protein